MTKRLLALILVCILAIPIMVVPAHATGWDADDSNKLTEMHSFLQSINTYCRNIYSQVLNVYYAIAEDQYALLSNFKGILQDFYDDWDVWEDEVIQAFTNLGTTITDSLTSNTSRIKQYFLDLRTDLGERFTSVGQWITDQTTALSTKFDNLQTALSEKLDSVQSAITGKIELLQSALSDRLDSIKNLLSGTPEDLEQSEQAGDRTDDQTGDLEDLGQQMATQPSVTPEELDPIINSGGQVLGQANTFYFAAMSAIIDEMAPFFIMVFFFGISGYLLYGRRY